MKQTNTIKVVSFKEAEEIIYKETRIDELLLEMFEKRQIPIKNILNTKMIKDGKMTIDFQMKAEKDKKRECLCLFHPTENVDSYLLLESNIFYCFRGGCPASKPGINVIHLYMMLKFGVKKEVVNTPAAYKEKARAIFELSERLGYKVETKKTKMTPADKQRLTLQTILNRSAAIYHEEFLKNELAQKYFLETEVEVNGEKLKGRGFKYAAVDPNELIKNFKIGFAPENFPSTFLYDKLCPDFTTEELLQSSVVKWIGFKDADGAMKDEKAVDFHSFGLMIPYFSRRRVTNLYSRALVSTKEWRHLRLAGSVDEPIHFDEGTRFENVNLVEGELSWLSMIALAYPNTLGNRGTNGLDDSHVEMLVKVREDSKGAYCKTIYIIFDGDEAGYKATIETGKKLLKYDFDVRVVRLPEGMDPNDIMTVYKEGAKAFMDKLYSEAISYYAFVALQKISKGYTSPADRIKEYAAVKALLSEFGVKSQTELYLIAKEFSEIANIPIEVIWDSWKKENKCVDVLFKQPFAFITNDLEGFYLTKSRYEGRTAYVEDTTFSFVNSEVAVSSLVCDAENYSEEDLNMIEGFCAQHGVRFYPIADFKNIYKMDDETLMVQLLGRNPKNNTK